MAERFFFPILIVKSLNLSAKRQIPFFVLINKAVSHDERRLVPVPSNIRNQFKKNSDLCHIYIEFDLQTLAAFIQNYIDVRLHLGIQYIG